MRLVDDFATVAPCWSVEEQESVQLGITTIGDVHGKRWIVLPNHSITNDECIPRGYVVELSLDCPVRPELFDSKVGFGVAVVKVI